MRAVGINANHRNEVIKMSKIAIVYWSGTGNTEAMAKLAAEGARVAGAQVDILTCGDFDVGKAPEYDAIAFGCPAMGSEQLEEDEFEPMFTACKPALKGKRIALFGSYGWGDGEWMRAWEADAKACGALLACESVICADAPDAEASDACRKLGEAVCGQ